MLSLYTSAVLPHCACLTYVATSITILDSTDAQGVQTIRLLSAILATRSKDKILHELSVSWLQYTLPCKYFVHVYTIGRSCNHYGVHTKSYTLKLMFLISQGTVNLDEEAERLPSFPQVIRLGHDESAQYYIVVEKKVLLESANIQESILDLISTYFCFDIAYPRQLYPVFLFIQHIILNIMDKQKVPNNLTSTHAPNPYFSAFSLMSSFNITISVSPPQAPLSCPVCPLLLM